MAAVTELASEVGTRAACQALNMPRASYYRIASDCCPEATASRPSPAACSCSGGTRNGLGASARRTLPGSLASRCVCDVAR